MIAGLSEALRGINGNYELNRLVGFFGGITYTICANAFVGYEVFWLGRAFDVTAYCLAFPAGVAAIATGTAAAVAVKDRGVASSKVIEATGSKPATPPAPAPAPQPDLVEPPAQPTDEELPDYAR